MFPYHVQAISAFSLLITYPKACVHTLGKGDSVVYEYQVNQYGSYNPTVAFLVDPLNIPFYNNRLKLPDKFGILDYSQRVQYTKTGRC